MKQPTTSPCTECPFLKTAARGYLGEDQPAHFAAVAAIGEEPLPCHCTVDYSDDAWKEKLDDARQCAGHAIFLSNSAKSPRNEDVKTLPKSDDVFRNGIEFVMYHASVGRGEAISMLQEQVLAVRLSD